MKTIDVNVVRRVYENFGCIVLGSTARCPFGVVINSVISGRPPELKLLPQPFAVAAESTQQEWRDQHKFCFEQGLIAHMYEPLDSAFYYRLVTE